MDVKISARIANKTELFIFRNTKNCDIPYCTVLCRILKSAERNVGLVPRYRQTFMDLKFSTKEITDTLCTHVNFSPKCIDRSFGIFTCTSVVLSLHCISHVLSPDVCFSSVGNEIIRVWHISHSGVNHSYCCQREDMRVRQNRN